MIVRQEILDFVEHLQELYLIKRDINGLLACMDERISWIGTGEGEVSRNLTEAKEALEKEFAEYSGSFQVDHQEFEVVPLSDVSCIAYGRIHTIAEAEDVEDQNLRVTLICKQTEQGMKLVHCNISVSDYVQKKDHFYVPKHVRTDNSALWWELQSRERQIQNLTQNVPGGVHQCANDPNLTLISMSDSFLTMFGYTREEIKDLFDDKFIDMVYPGDRADMLRSTNEQLKRGDSIDLEYRVLCKNGKPLWILDKGRLMDDGMGNMCFYCILIDITERKREQEELRLSLERHQVIMNQATDIIFEWDIVADSLIFSSNWFKKYGYDPISEKISKQIPLSSHIHPEDTDVFKKIMHDTAAGVPYSEAEFRIQNMSGEYNWSRIRATAQFNEDGRAIKAVGVIIDIDEEKRVQQKLLEMANKDALTGLYNKNAMKKLVEKHMEAGYKNGLQAMAIIDIDNFKTVNDRYGHLCGDALLSNIADILKSQFRSSDLLGQIGGDEFIVYLPEIAGKKETEKKMNHLLEALSEIKPMKNADSITCSIGVALFPHGETDYYTIYQCADQALYDRKNQGKSGVTFYRPELGCNGPACGLARTAINEAIESNEASIVDEKLAQYTFRMLYKSIDTKTAVNKILEIVGHSYDVSRVYIFENDETGMYCNNTFEWCAQGVPSEMEHLQMISYEDDLGGYLDNFGEDGVFYCRDITALHPKLYDVLAPQGIQSVLQCAIMDEGKFKGYVGFDECRENRFWTKQQIASLSLVAKVLSVFLVKLRLEEEVEQLKEKIKED